MTSNSRIVLSLFAPFGGGGVIQVFRNLRSATAEFGVDLRWLACGAQAMEAARRHARPEDWLSGEVVGPDLEVDREKGAEYRRQIVDRSPSAVLLHVMCGQVESNLAAYLPREIPRIAFVHTITPSTYRGARAMRGYLHATIGVSPRIREDLVTLCGFPADRTFCIPNGLNCQEFSGLARADVGKGPLRILSCGRIEDVSKGVFWLPQIIKKARARGLDARLTVAGDGPDRAELERRINTAGLQTVTEFRGWVESENLPRLYAEHEIAIFPSRFEGFLVALIESMASGCVPLATKIRGVTDFVVEDGRTGLLFPSGDTETAARLLVDLAADPTRLKEMRNAGRSATAGRFGVQSQARAFAGVVDQVVFHPRKITDPQPIEKWEIARGLKPAWWTSLPEPVKNGLRVLRERAGVI
jgi:glycosyltransferase involved in cell wall biosynthesis